MQKQCCIEVVPTSTTRFASDVGCWMAKNLIGLYKEIMSMIKDIKSHRMKNTVYVTDFEDRYGLCASVIFLLQYMWFPVHLCTG